MGWVTCYVFLAVSITELALTSRFYSLENWTSVNLKIWLTGIIFCRRTGEIKICEPNSRDLCYISPSSARITSKKMVSMTIFPIEKELEKNPGNLHQHNRGPTSEATKPSKISEFPRGGTARENNVALSMPKRKTCGCATRPLWRLQSAENVFMGLDSAFESTW